MIKNRLTPPYNKGKTTFKKRNVAGVYLIYIDSVLMYVGYSGNNLYRTMYRHFQRWSHPRQQVFTYDPAKAKVRVIYTNTPQQAYNLEKALIVKLKPKDNTNGTQLDLTPAENKVYYNYIDEDIKPVYTNINPEDFF